MSRLYLRKLLRGYDWDEIPAKAPEKGCEGCRKHIGYTKGSDGREYSECRRFYACYKGDYSVLVPMEGTPCARFSGVLIKKSVTPLGETNDPLLFGKGFKKEDTE